MKNKSRRLALFVLLPAIGLFLLCGCGRHSEIGLVLGPKEQANGLRRIDQGDGRTVATNAFASPCRRLEERPETYLYLQVAPAFKKRAPMTVSVTVECLAAQPGSFDVQYDGGTPDTPYTASADRVELSGSGEWQTETFEVDNARFQNRQNGRADFRLRVNCPEFYVRRVAVSRD
jgi:hypothetical protein